MEVIGRGSRHGHRRRGLRDRRVGDPRPPAAHDQQRRPALAAGGLPVRPAPAAPHRDAGAPRDPGRRPPRAEPRAACLRRTGEGWIVADTTSGRRSRKATDGREPAGDGPSSADGASSADGRRARRGEAPPRRPARPARRATDTADVAARHGRRRAGRPEPTLRILETRVLRGPNYWAREPVIRQVVDLGVARGVPVEHDPRLRRRPDRAPAVARGPRLLAGPARRIRHPAARRDVDGPRRRACRARAPEPGRHRRAARQDAGDRRARPVQRDLRVPRGAGRARGRSDGRRARQPPRGARRPGGRVRPRRRSSSGLIRLAERLAFGPSTQALIDEAVGRDIPYIRLDRYSLVQLGQGVHQQRIRATMTSRTSGIAVDIASDKKLTNRLLDSAGLPVPRERGGGDRGRGGRGGAASRLPVRRQAARREPRPGRRARPAATRRPSGRRSRGAAPEPGGGRHRRVVRHGQRLPRAWSSAASSRPWPSACPARVTGDGEHTVRELVELDERRSAARHRPREGAHAGSGSTQAAEAVLARPGPHARRRARGRRAA